jgi:aminopeptidase N
LVLAGSGVEVAATDGAERQERIFIGGPQRDFFLAASARFETASKKVGDTKLTVYFPEEFRDSGMLVLETAEHALNSYNQRFGLYPYIELDLISTPMNAGGMEYSTATSLSINYFDPEYTVGALIFLEAVVAHEVAHQWFFNQVMSDQIEEPWLDEGLVQYATYLYYVDRYGESNAQGYMDSWYERWSRVELAPIPIGKPAGAYTREEYSPIIYGRGPLFFTALKAKMGAEAFNRLLLTYAQEYRWGIAYGEDFKELAQETCGCDLESLFADWVDVQ